MKYTRKSWERRHDSEEAHRARRLDVLKEKLSWIWKTKEKGYDKPLPENEYQGEIPLPEKKRKKYRSPYREYLETKLEKHGSLPCPIPTKIKKKPPKAFKEVKKYRSWLQEYINTKIEKNGPNPQHIPTKVKKKPPKVYKVGPEDKRRSSAGANHPNRVYPVPEHDDPYKYEPPPIEFKPEGGKPPEVSLDNKFLKGVR